MQRIRGSGRDQRPVGRAMDRWPLALPASMGVREALGRLLEDGRDCAVVEDGAGDRIGVVTLETLLRERELQTRSDDTLGMFSLTREATVEELVVPGWLAVNEDAPLHLAAALMAHEHVAHLPVVDGEGEVVGTVSALDIARELAAYEGYAVSGPHHVFRAGAIHGESSS